MTLSSWFWILWSIYSTIVVLVLVVPTKRNLAALPDLVDDEVETLFRLLR